MLGPKRSLLADFFTSLLPAERKEPVALVSLPYEDGLPLSLSRTDPPGIALGLEDSAASASELSILISSVVLSAAAVVVEVEYFVVNTVDTVVYSVVCSVVSVVPSSVGAPSVVGPGVETVETVKGIVDFFNNARAVVGLIVDVEFGDPVWSRSSESSRDTSSSLVTHVSPSHSVQICLHSSSSHATRQNTPKAKICWSLATKDSNEVSFPPGRVRSRSQGDFK